MNYINEYFDKRQKEDINAFEKQKLNEYLTDVLPGQMEEYKNAYTGDPDKLEDELKEYESGLITEFQETELDELAADELERLRTVYEEEFREMLELWRSEKHIGQNADISVPLASEVIADQGKEIEKLRAKLVDVIDDKLEDCICAVLDAQEKASYILNLSITNHNLLNTDAPTQSDLEVFYGQKAKMLTECWIVDDYLDRIKEEAGKLDDIRRELNKLQEGGADGEM